jgi:hypothetical protein
LSVPARNRYRESKWLGYSDGACTVAHLPILSKGGSAMLVPFPINLVQRFARAGVEIQK